MFIGISVARLQMIGRLDSFVRDVAHGQRAGRRYCKLLDLLNKFGEVRVIMQVLNWHRQEGCRKRGKRAVYKDR